MNGTFKHLILGTKTFIYNNSSTIFTCVALAGVVSTTSLAIEATPRAAEAIKEIPEKEKTKWNVVKIAAPYYIPTMLSGALTATCIICANSINLRKNAALAGACSIAETSLKEYQSKVVETIGEGKAKKIKDAIAEDAIKNNPVSQNEIIMTGNGDVLCYDCVSGRYFMHDIEKLRKIQNDINRDMFSDMCVSLNEVYYAMGLNGIGVGEELGWTIDYPLEFSFTSKLTEDNKPCLVIDYVYQPFTYRLSL